MRQAFIFLTLVLAFATTSCLSVAADDTLSATNSTVGHSDGTSKDDGRQRVLRSVDAEERLAGANKFAEEKIRMAMSDTSYFKKLMERWGRHRVTVEEALAKVEPAQAYYPSAAEVYRGYAMGGKKMPKSDAAMKEKIKDTIDDVATFKDLTLSGYTPDDVLKLAGEDTALRQFHAKYRNWHRLHHPNPGELPAMTATHFLFERSRVERAMKDREFAFRLFAKWEKAGFGREKAFSEMEKFGLEKDAAARLRKLFSEWKPEPRKSWLRRFLDRVSLAKKKIADALGRLFTS